MKRQSRRPGPSLLTTCALPAKRTGRAVMKKKKRSAKNTCPRKRRSKHFLRASTTEVTNRGLVMKLKLAKPHFISTEAPWATGTGMKPAHAPHFSGLCGSRKPCPRPPRKTYAGQTGRAWRAQLAFCLGLAGTRSPRGQTSSIMTTLI